MTDSSNGATLLDERIYKAISAAEIKDNGNSGYNIECTIECTIEVGDLTDGLLQEVRATILELMDWLYITDDALTVEHTAGARNLTFTISDADRSKLTDLKSEAVAHLTDHETTAKPSPVSAAPQQTPPAENAPISLAERRREMQNTTQPPQQHPASAEAPEADNVLHHNFGHQSPEPQQTPPQNPLYDRGIEANYYKVIARGFIEELSKANPGTTAEKTMLAAYRSDSPKQDILNVVIALMMTSLHQNINNEPEILQNADIDIKTLTDAEGKSLGIIITSTGEDHLQKAQAFQQALTESLKTIDAYTTDDIQACIKDADAIIADAPETPETPHARRGRTEPANKTYKPKTVSDDDIKASEDELNKIAAGLQASEVQTDESGNRFLKYRLEDSIKDNTDQSDAYEDILTHYLSELQTATQKHIDYGHACSLTIDDDGTYVFSVYALSQNANGQRIDDAKLQENIEDLRGKLPAIVKDATSPMRVVRYIERIEEYGFAPEAAEKEHENDAYLESAKRLYQAIMHSEPDHRTFVDNEGNSQLMVHINTQAAGLLNDYTLDTVIEFFNSICANVSKTSKTECPACIGKILETDSTDTYIYPDSGETSESPKLTEGVDTLTQPEGYDITLTFPNAGSLKETAQFLLDHEDAFNSHIRREQLGKGAQSIMVH